MIFINSTLLPKTLWERCAAVHSWCVGGKANKFHHNLATGFFALRFKNQWVVAQRLYCCSLALCMILVAAFCCHCLQSKKCSLCIFYFQFDIYSLRNASPYKAQRQSHNSFSKRILYKSLCTFSIRYRSSGSSNSNTNNKNGGR